MTVKPVKKKTGIENKKRGFINSSLAIIEYILLANLKFMNTQKKTAINNVNLVDEMFFIFKSN